jgi:hypothetical protein
MASKVQICNMALSRLGASTITSLTDNTTEAKLCNTLFNDLADRVMIQGSWATTIKRVVLAKTTTTPTYGFSSEFQLPVDPKALKIISIDEDIPGSIEYKIEGDKLLSDEAAMKIKYVAQLTDTQDYGPALTEAVEVLLTSYLAIPIAGDRSLAEKLRQEYVQIVSHNLAIDGQQGSKDTVISVDLTEVR